MRSIHRRVPYLVLLNMLLWGLLPTRAPSGIHLPDMFAHAPEAEEIALFEELTSWIIDQPTGSDSAHPIREAIQDSANFDFFCSFHGEDARQHRLQQLPFGREIRQTAERYSLDGLLLASVIETESRFNPLAISHRGAMGLMQVMPATAALEDPTPLLDPRKNLEIGAKYLRYLLKLYEGDLELALAAYNAGPGAVRRFDGLPPFRETQRYVEKVLATYVDHHRQIWRDSDVGRFLVAG